VLRATPCSSSLPRPLRRARPRTCGALALAAALFGCGGPASTPAGNAEAKAEAKAATKAEAKAEAKADADPPPAADPTKNPWKEGAIRELLTPGSKVVYARKGTDRKGKKVDDEITFMLQRNADDGAGTSFTIAPDPGTNAATSQVATTGWSDLSPFFAMEKVAATIEGRESLTVAAGTFETSKAVLKDYFQNEKQVWLIVEQPGVYAKVVEVANTLADESDKTDLTYELKAFTRGE
jgi:hypothetical protein